MAGQKIKLAILDDYAGIALSKFQTLAQSHPNLEIHNFPQTINVRTSSGLSQVVSQLSSFTIISTMRERTPFQRPLLEQLPNLKLLLTTGLKNAGIDTAACHDLKIAYTGTPGFSTPGVNPRYASTNEQTWALILGLAKHISAGDHNIKTSTSDGWQSGTLTYGLAGKTLGLLGLGKLGTSAAITGALGFGMRIIAWSTSLTQAHADAEAAKVGLPAGTFHVVGSKAELCASADVLSVHYVLSPRSVDIIGRDELAVMKPTALLVNTSRGPLIDEAALLETVRAGKIGGVALDVFDTEPLPKDSPWRRDDWGANGSSQVLLSPHLGYVEERTMHMWYEKQVEIVDRWLKGEELIHVM